MSDIWCDTNRPLKPYVRRLVASVCGKAKQNAIMFPASKAHDVRAFLDAGILTKKTTLTAIEYDPKIAKQMWVSLFNLGMARKTKVHRGEAHTLKVSKPVDLAFLDFCGPGTIEEMDWIHYLVPNITGPTSDVIFTFKANNRGAGYFADHQKRMIGTPAFREELALIRRTPTWKVDLKKNISVCQSTEPSLRALACVRLALRRSFSGFDFKVQSTIYRDLDLSKGTTAGSREMLLIHFSDFRRVGSNVLAWS